MESSTEFVIVMPSLPTGDRIRHPSRGQRRLNESADHSESIEQIL
jgi:hypothetical protein